jgi:hypothetical protein
MSSSSGKGKLGGTTQVSTKIHFNFLIFLMFIYDTPCIWKTKRWCFFSGPSAKSPTDSEFQQHQHISTIYVWKKEEVSVNSLSEDSSMSIKMHFSK